MTYHSFIQMPVRARAMHVYKAANDEGFHGLSVALGVTETEINAYYDLGRDVAAGVVP